MRQEEQNEDKVTCPKCGSSQIHVDKKGFSGAKGCCGFLVCGPLGFLFGQSGASKLEKHCLKCGNKWH